MNMRDYPALHLDKNQSEKNQLVIKKIWVYMNMRDCPTLHLDTD